MGKYYAFHKTVKGYLHEKKEIPCEDYSESCSVQDASGVQFHIAVVADGHGDTACMRSRLGSKKAAEIAKECLTEFAESVISDMQDTKDVPDLYKGCQRITDMLNKAAVYGRDARNILKARVPESLTNAIVSRWYAFVNDDIRQNPLSEEEIDQAGRYADAYREGRRLAHVYGTTLIAALMLPGYLLLIQQGDGRCDVFYEDGTVAQPIPWDERCHENVTTSMCDEDAPARIRSRVIALDDKKVIACYLGSDGVEDAYRDMEGTHMFYRDLTCELVERGVDKFEAYLAEMLPRFSQTGSGDDVSVSGIVDVERVKEFVPSFRMKIRQYDLKEELNRYENRIISMSRKHRILKEQAEEAEKEYLRAKRQMDIAEAEYNEAEAQYNAAADKARRYEHTWEEWENEVKKLKAKLQESVKNKLKDGSRESAQCSRGDSLKRFKQGFSHPRENRECHRKKINEREKVMKECRSEYDRVRSEEMQLYDRMREKEDNVELLKQNLNDIAGKHQKAQQEFTEYDRESQLIKEEIERINREMSNMSEKKVPILQEEKNGIAPECRGAEILSDGQDTDMDALVKTGEQGELLSDGQDTDIDALVKTREQDEEECQTGEGGTYDSQCECDTGKVPDGQGTVLYEGAGVERRLDTDMGI